MFPKVVAAPPTVRVVPSRSCGDLAFEPATESGVYAVTATGTDCVAALAVAAASRGFACIATKSPVRGYPTWNYVCTAGSRRVTFNWGP